MVALRKGNKISWADAANVIHFGRVLAEPQEHPETGDSFTTIQISVPTEDVEPWPRPQASAARPGGSAKYHRRAA